MASSLATAIGVTFVGATVLAEPAPSASVTAGSTPAPPPLVVDDAALQKIADAEAEVIEIDDSAPAESASSVHLGTNDLLRRSRTQVSDILRQVPGLMVSQHAGGGKADQYFIRGFDSDHGTDIAVFADGIPVNLPSHGHGQGYADTHFLIPEAIESVDVHKGPYSARFGDFYTAGAMELKTLDSVDGPTVWIAGGAPLGGGNRFDNYNRRVVGMASPELRAGDKTLLAVQLGDSDGPFDNPQQFRMVNALGKWKGRVGPGELRLSTVFYAAKWNASGQIPESAVTDHVVDRFGSLDPSEGGNTSRASGQLEYTYRDDHSGTWRAMAYGLRSELQLYSNFTLYARDPMHGDEIEQQDARWVYGADASYSKHADLAGMDSIITTGVMSRNDHVENGLWHDDRRARLADCFGDMNPCNHTLDNIHDLAAYTEATIHVFPHVHVLPGLRVERISWGVDDLAPGDMPLSGNATKTVVLPKLSVEVEATDKLNVFANAGSGFHSNDARAAVSGVGELARALGAETGIRTTYLPHGKLSADVWYLHLDSELVWSGDAGGTDPSGSTRRYGADLEAQLDPLPWLHLDGTLSLAHSELVHNAGNSMGLALAPKVMGQGGVTVGGAHSFVALRARGIGDRPGNDDGTLVAKGYLIFDAIAAYRPMKQLDLNLTVNNLLNTDWREAQFADASRITPTSPVVEQMHFTPGIPLTATVTATYTF